MHVVAAQRGRHPKQSDDVCIFGLYFECEIDRQPLVRREMTIVAPAAELSRLVPICMYFATTALSALCRKVSSNTCFLSLKSQSQGPVATYHCLLYKKQAAVTMGFSRRGNVVVHRSSCR